MTDRSFGFGARRLSAGATNGIPFVLQGLGSISNLVISWFLVGQIGVSGFGFFTVYFTAAVALVTLTGALIVQPLNSVASRLSAERQAQFVRAATFLNRAVNVSLAIIWVLALAATAAVGAAQQHVLAIGLFAVSMNIGEFQRRLAFFRRRPIDVLWYDALRYGLILASFAAVSMSASSPTVLAYTSAMSASYLVTALVLPIARPDNETSISSLAVLWAQSRRLLRSGRWLVATNLMRLVNAQFVVFVAFFVLGAYETGLIRVAQTIVGVANPLIQGMEHVVPVALGRTIRERGVAMAIGQYRKLSLGLIAIFALLYGPLTVVSPFILRLFTVEADTQAILLVAGFSLGSLFNVLLTLVLFELRAREMTELSSVALFASGFLAIVIAYPAIEMLGLAGVVLTICITQALGIALLVTKALHRIKSRNVSKLNEQNALAP